MSPSFLEAFRQHLLQMGSDPLCDASSPIVSTIVIAGDRQLRIQAGTINFNRIDDPEKDALLDSIIAAADGVIAIEPEPEPEHGEDTSDPAPSESEPQVAGELCYYIAPLPFAAADQFIISIMKDYMGATGTEELKVSTTSLPTPE